MSPRLLATAIALPVAVLTGAVVYNLGVRAGQSADPSAQPNAAATGPVTVSAPPLPSRAAVVCRALVAKLPDRVRDAQRRPVSAGAEQNAAYGDPALVLSCGVPSPSYPSTDDVWTLNGVCWHATPASGSTVWTTVDREIPVQVTVPGPADGASQWVIGFATAVATAVPSVAKIPTGCIVK